jgi:flagellar basal-body rod modification protein FlgD
MQVSSTSAAASMQGSSTTSPASAASLDYTAFLRLLIAEMRNQDPTSPGDPTQYMAQLASFANVEQAVQTNAKLDALLTSTALSQADGLIGRTLTSADGSVTGVIKSISLTSGGAVAILEDGTKVAIGPGITLS